MLLLDNKYIYIFNSSTLLTFANFNDSLYFRDAMYFLFSDSLVSNVIIYNCTISSDLLSHLWETLRSVCFVDLLNFWRNESYDSKTSVYPYINF